MKETWYVDMDDVMADFAGQAYLDLQRNPAIRYPQSQFDFFRKLRPISDSVESINEMVEIGLDVWFLTRPSVFNPLCYTEKRMWIEDHLGLEFCHKLILCPDKGRVGTENDFLIDDMDWTAPSDPELTPWKGTQLQFGQPPFNNWKRVMSFIRHKYVKENQVWNDIHPEK